MNSRPAVALGSRPQRRGSTPIIVTTCCGGFCSSSPSSSRSTARGARQAGPVGSRLAGRCLQRRRPARVDERTGPADVRTSTSATARTRSRRHGLARRAYRERTRAPGQVPPPARSRHPVAVTADLAGGQPAARRGFVASSPAAVDQRGPPVRTGLARAREPRDREARGASPEDPGSETPGCLRARHSKATVSLCLVTHHQPKEGPNDCHHRDVSDRDPTVHSRDL